MPTVKKAPKKLHSINGSSPSEIMISAWEQDPGLMDQPEGGRLIQLPEPQISATSLPSSIAGTIPAAKLYQPNTSEFRYWNTASALARGSKFWSALLPGTQWQVGSVLPVKLDAGSDLNAFYDRIGLSFFHGRVGNRFIFSCDSPDVVCHEQGHAILDSIKPQLWDAASIEAAAFHEAFGDISAILSALQLQSVRLSTINETQGSIYRSSRLSRLAEQLGWAIRQSHPGSVEGDCLRNAVNSFFYSDPNTLPTNAPASSLSSESHSFSRVFTSAFFEGLAGMFRLHQTQDERSLLEASIDLAQALVMGVKSAAVVPTFFSQVAVNMIACADKLKPNSNNGQALKSAFIRHGIISPAASFSFRSAIHSLFSDGLTDDNNNETELPKLSLSVAEYDLGVDTIIVHSASEPKRFDIAGAAMGIGSATAPSQDEAAKAYVEDLLRTGRLKVKKSGQDRNHRSAVSRSGEPQTHETHTHELRLEGGDYVLRRVRIACSFH
jgi:hypothetical protein